MYFANTQELTASDPFRDRQKEESDATLNNRRRKKLIVSISSKKKPNRKPSQSKPWISTVAFVYVKNLTPDLFFHQGLSFWVPGPLGKHNWFVRHLAGCAQAKAGDTADTQGDSAGPGTTLD